MIGLSLRRTIQLPPRRKPKSHAQAGKPQAATRQGPGRPAARKSGTSPFDRAGWGVKGNPTLPLLERLATALDLTLNVSLAPAERRSA
jgi:hypothetical protein